MDGAETLALERDDALLGAIVEGVEAELGADFFRSLVRSLAQVLGVSYAFVSELTHAGERFRTLALWARGAFATDLDAPLAGTPCEAVLGGRAAFHPDCLQALFPTDRLVSEWNAVSYGGVPMFDSHGVVVGHLAFLHDQPLTNQASALAVMRIFAKRAVAEIERLRIMAALQASEERLASILDSAMDAIITSDEDGRIVLFNRAAERLLRCPAEQAIGTPVARFASAEGGDMQRYAIDRLRDDPSARIFLSEEEGLLARRADGSSFHVEASLSRSSAGGRVLHTNIFRDVEERRAAARALSEARSQNAYLRGELAEIHAFEEIVGRSPALAGALQEVELVARTDSTVLILGETGTGKELVARAIHAKSRRAERPLVKVNCAAIPAGLLESELFGHEKGAFTGATAAREGRVELAERGTLFLDEIGELPLEMQSKLLRVLQEREYERVGSSRTLRADVRVIVATNRDLETAAAEGRFRSDLFYRLNVFPVTLPPLRERAGDVDLLASFFIARHAPHIGRSATRPAAAALARLRAYPWPGNVRELENVIERALILAPRDAVELDVPEALLAGVRGAGSQPRAAAPPPGRDAPRLAEVERAHIEATLRAAGWRIEGDGGAARRLGLRPSTLRSRMKKLGIRREPGVTAP